MIGKNNNSVTLTTREAVQSFLSSGGPAEQLSGKLTNPGDIKNVLASQTAATTLNYLQWNSLAGATLKSGPYAGKTVVEVVNLANQAQALQRPC